jgi:hypothetical protein
MGGLRGSVSVDEDLKEALLSPRLSAVEAAMEHALKAHPGEFDQNLFNQVNAWYKELDKRTGLLQYCKSIRGQGWDGECLAVNNWWNGVKGRSRMEKPWQSH